MAILEIKDLMFRAGDKEILNGFTMTMEPLEVHALLGTNGTGKSTLAYLIMGCEGYKPVSKREVYNQKQ
jgi:Fe-S cluster assembly ATP-binding protein